MKIVRIGENSRIVHNDEVKISRNKKSLSPSEDEVILKKKTVDTFRGIINEMKKLQEDTNFMQAKLEAIKRLSDFLKTINPDNVTLDDNAMNEIRKIYESSKFGDRYVLEDVKDGILSRDLMKVYDTLSSTTDKMESEFEESKRKSYVLTIKFQNINAAIENISNDKVEGTVKLILSSIGKTDSILRMDRNIVNRIISDQVFFVFF
ncbi:MAG: hypothetical protein ACPL4C_06810 [Brevinematia bacterium]